MITEISLPLAFFAGLVAFLSPCILPVIPSYITIISGVGYKDLAAGRYERKRMLVASITFVLGFSVVFVLMGIVFSSTGLLLGNLSSWVNRIAGIIVILFGLNYIFDFIKFFNVEKRIHLANKPKGPLGTFLIGATFGAGWTPCIGPILSSVLIMAGTSGEVLKGSILLGLFSFGLGFPFILTGIFFARSKRLMDGLKKRLGIIKKVGGLFMILIGILIFNGALLVFNGTLFGWASSLRNWNTESPTMAKMITVIPLLLLILLLIRSLVVKYLEKNNRSEDELVHSGLLVEKNHPTIVFSIVRVGGILILTIGVIGIWLGFISPYELISQWLSFTGI